MGFVRGLLVFMTVFWISAVVTLLVASFVFQGNPVAVILVPVISLALGLVAVFFARSRMSKETPEKR
jgi:hypothetical protein